MTPPRRLAGAALPLLLAACVADPAPGAAEALLTRTLASHRASVGAAGGIESGTPAGDPVVVPGAARPAAVPPAARPLLAPPPDAAALLGQPPEALLRLLGAPLLRRREGDAEIWRYGGGACQLDLVLYPLAGGDGVRVGWAAARAEGAARVTEAECLTAVSRGAGRAGA